jgi:hypothetical protein
MKEKAYTLKEIAQAWWKFTQPQWITSRDEIGLETHGLPEEASRSLQKLEIDYSNWLAYLMSEEWKD